MTKTYRIEVDCANCANRMEQEILKIEGVESASVHFFTSKLTVTFTEGADVERVLQTVIQKCKRIEDDFEIYL